MQHEGPRSRLRFIALSLLLTLGVACAPAKKPKHPGDDEGQTSLYNLEIRAQGGMEAAEQTLSALREAQVRISMVVAQALSVGATLWVTSHESCPTPDDIIGEHFVTEQVRVEDAWDNPFHIECTGGDDDAIVTSAGPDGILGTADDIVYGRHK